jgi:NAD-dependent SIR2 family protein deacetylase
MHSQAEVLQSFREAVRKAQHIIVIAGAGLSAASGQFSCQRAPV